MVLGHDGTEEDGIYYHVKARTYPNPKPTRSSAALLRCPHGVTRRSAHARPGRVQIQSSGEIVRLKFSELMQRCKVELLRVRG